MVAFSLKGDNMVYIIAEAGVDHEGSLKRALQLL